MRGNSSDSQPDLFGDDNPLPYKIKCRTHAAHTPLHRQGPGDGKLCKRCKLWKPYEEYSWCPSDGRFYRHSRCKTCNVKYYKNYVASPEGRKARKGWSLRARYGISMKTYEAMFKAQGGACAICGATEMPIDPRTKRPHDLSVDHDHKTGALRALLCPNCNIGLGGFRDNIKTLHAAISYLKRFDVSP